ncbi:DUF3784 domain-containing protein [Flavobacterium sp. AG291]|uniref:DUF3784 domain-containing protein n=1 Tax=Flavobacterium sp. AG291 TaxID=2184000 RepID=UPI000E0B56BD|nr:DUF3784 domain-containing protein [Flavobacterium sp. AG291]RDI12132.1 uncharacterized protein DUF3784 [Flavobacterium sp. AG291]
MLAVAFIFIVAAIAVKYGKMYNLIAGYNTMSPAEKAKINIEAIATLFRNVFFGMAAVLIVSEILIQYSVWPELGEYIQIPALLIGTLWILLRSNSKKYRYDK